MSSMRPRKIAISPCRADMTLVGIIPSDGRWPTNLAFENVAAHAASPYPGLLPAAPPPRRPTPQPGGRPPE
eukprot:757466-Pleurochrysis_carterae.AAC.1